MTYTLTTGIVVPSQLTIYIKKKTNVCGTVRKNRKGMLSLKKKFKIKETWAKYTKKISTLKWKDRRDVFMLITIHENKSIK